MNKILDAMTAWLEELLGEAVLNNLTNMVTIVNEKVGTIASDVSQTPANFSPGIYNMIRNVSETVIIPIAGIIMTIIACYKSKKSLRKQTVFREIWNMRPEH